MAKATKIQIELTEDNRVVCRWHGHHPPAVGEVIRTLTHDDTYACAIGSDEALKGRELVVKRREWLYDRGRVICRLHGSAEIAL